MLLVACDADRFAVDLEDSDLELKVRRFDLELFALAPEEVSKFHRERLEKGDGFYVEFSERILGAGAVRDSLTPIRMQRFVQDPNWNSAQASVEERFGDFQQQRKELENAFKRYLAFFPNEKAPSISTYNAGYQFAIYPMDSVLGIGLEWFIGDTSSIVQRLAPEVFPEYKKRRMQPEFLVSSAMTGWLFVHHYKDLAGEDLLGNMVHHGKVLFALKRILPDMPDSLIIGYTRSQLDWCDASEFNIWAELAVNDAIFSKKPREIGHFMNDGPFTNGFPRESPGRIGEWVGWQMVESYMAEHEEMTIEQLFGDIDAHEVMKSYRPNKK